LTSFVLAIVCDLISAFQLVLSTGLSSSVSDWEDVIPTEATENMLDHSIDYYYPSNNTIFDPFDSSFELALFDSNCEAEEIAFSECPSGNTPRNSGCFSPLSEGTGREHERPKEETRRTRNARRLEGYRCSYEECGKLFDRMYELRYLILINLLNTSDTTRLF